MRLVSQIDLFSYCFAPEFSLNTAWIRLFYIGTRSEDNPQLILKELVKSNNGEWQDGALNKARIVVTEDTLISANVEIGGGDLKVFFNTKDDDDNTAPAVAWVVLGQTAWASRIIGKWK